MDVDVQKDIMANLTQAIEDASNGGIRSMALITIDADGRPQGGFDVDLLVDGQNIVSAVDKKRDEFIFIRDLPPTSLQ